MSNVTIIPARITKLRIDHNMTQAEFCKQLSSICTSQGMNPISISTISSWETGRRPISKKYYISIASLFNVELPYLLGLTNDTSAIMTEEEMTAAIIQRKYGASNNSALKGTEEILKTDLFHFDQKPVYLEFLDYQHQNEWGIYDHRERKIYCIHKTINVADGGALKNCRFYVQQPEYSAAYATSNKKKPIDLGRVMRIDKIFVRLNSPDPEMRALYDGWYRHNENHSALMKDGIGLVLPYSGIGISYTCFSDGDTDVAAK